MALGDGLNLTIDGRTVAAESGMTTVCRMVSTRRLTTVRVTSARLTSVGSSRARASNGREAAALAASAGKRVVTVALAKLIVLARADIEKLYSLGHRSYEGDHAIQTSSGAVRIWEFSSAPLGSARDDGGGLPADPEDVGAVGRVGA